MEYYSIIDGLLMRTLIMLSTPTEASSHASEQHIHALLEGYRAAFRTLLGLAVLYCLVGAIRLHGIGKISFKKE